ncbi:hypothetical protein E1301_Tti001313 [Triplophysa tibetana]|uniref:Uncharacterized protein n=1 Tax=Triplophysa tibetana TaxID=1572043 RepID=A0A5A9P866_9TELE|nr:hypothetical protein E1301_Tti001313 [Triplophysa tibetana]
MSCSGLWRGERLAKIVPLSALVVPRGSLASVRHWPVATGARLRFAFEDAPVTLRRSAFESTGEVKHEAKRQSEKIMRTESDQARAKDLRSAGGL